MARPFRRDVSFRVLEERGFLFRNLGNGRFDDMTPSLMLDRGASHGVSLADLDRDGDLDLALANNDPSARTHPIYQNQLADSIASRSLKIVVLDEWGRWTGAGVEIRVWEAGTDRRLGMRFVETGGGYSSQSVKPACFGLPAGTEFVCVEVTVLEGGGRIATRLENVSPRDYLGGQLEVRR